MTKLTSTQASRLNGMCVGANEALIGTKLLEVQSQILQTVDNIYYVDSVLGLDANDGLSWATAFKTIQGAVTVAAAIGNKGLNVDVYVKSGVYTEYIVIPDCDSGGLTAMGASMAEAGTLRIIGVGYVKVTYAGAHPTISVLRPCTQLIGLVVQSSTAQAAVYAICENNIDAGGTDDAGFAAGLVIDSCNIRAGGPDDTPVASSKGMYLLGALKTVISNCVIECFVNGIEINGSSVNFALYNTIENCKFDGNTNDLYMNAIQYSYVINCDFLSAASTAYLTTNAGLTVCTGCKIVGGTVQASVTTKFVGTAGWSLVGMVGAAAAPLYDLDLAS
jgi:hypothetical protein